MDGLGAVDPQERRRRLLEELARVPAGARVRLVSALPWEPLPASLPTGGSGYQWAEAVLGFAERVDGGRGLQVIEGTLAGLWLGESGRAAALRSWLAWLAARLESVPGLDRLGDRRLSRIYVRLLHRELDLRRPASAREAWLGRTAEGWEGGQRDQEISAVIEANPRGRWTLQGDPGSGKSTLLRELARVRALAALERLEAGEAASLPLLIHLPELAERVFGGSAPRTPVPEVIESFRRYKPEACEAVGAALEAALERGEALLLLDGFDELRPEHREAARGLVSEWSHLYRNTAIVLTSRRFGYERPSEDFVELELLPLGEEERAELLGKLIPDSARLASVLDQIAEPGPLRDMAGNPFILTLLAVLANEAEPGARLPTRRLALYQRSIEYLVQGWPRREAARRRGEAAGRRCLEVEPELLREALRALALALIEDHAEPWSTGEIASHLMRVEAGRRLHGLVESPGELPEALEADTGLLVGMDRDHRGHSTRWRFLHRSLLECLAAEALRERGFKRITRFAVRVTGEERIYLPWTWGRKEQTGRWAEVFTLLAGMEVEGHAPIAFVRRMRKVSEALAVRALANVEEVSVEDLVGEILGTDSRELGLGVLRELITRLSDREALGRVLVRVCRERKDRVIHQLCGAALLATEAPKEHLDEVRHLAGGAVALGIPERPWVLCPAGDFLMGSLNRDWMAGEDERPRHRVRLTRDFEMMATPVTQALYVVVMGEEPSFFKGDLARPVERVTWEGAVVFCRALERMGGGPGIRLPTEAEWEYACRAGTETRWFFGHEETRLGDYAWFGANAERQTWPVGGKQPNPWGLYDIHGNIWEWCRDLYREDEYTRRAEVRTLATDDPVVEDAAVANIGNNEYADNPRVTRGGSFGSTVASTRSAARSRADPRDESWFQGFRCVRSSRRQP